MGEETTLPSLAGFYGRLGRGRTSSPKRIGAAAALPPSLAVAALPSLAVATLPKMAASMVAVSLPPYIRQARVHVA